MAAEAAEAAAANGLLVEAMGAAKALAVVALGVVVVAVSWVVVAVAAAVVVVCCSSRPPSRRARRAVAHSAAPPHCEATEAARDTIHELAVLTSVCFVVEPCVSLRALPCGKHAC